MDGVRKALNDKGLTLEQAKTTVNGRMEWIEFVNKMSGKDVREDWHETQVPTQDPQIHFNLNSNLKCFLDHV